MKSPAGRACALALAVLAAACARHTTVYVDSDPEPDGGGPGSAGGADDGGDCEATASCDDDAHLVAHFPLDGDARDLARSGAACAVSGAVAAADRFGAEGRALHFDPARSARVVCPENAALPIARSPRTLAFWFRTPPAPDAGTYYQSMVTWGVADSDERFGVSTYAEMSMFTAQYDDLRDTRPVRDDAWHHAAAVVADAGGVTYYVDGALRLTGPFASLDTTGRVLAMGFKNDAPEAGTDPAATEYFQGDLDDVRVYDRALSAAEVAALVRAEGFAP